MDKLWSKDKVKLGKSVKIWSDKPIQKKRKKRKSKRRVFGLMMRMMELKEIWLNLPGLTRNCWKRR